MFLAYRIFVKLYAFPIFSVPMKIYHLSCIKVWLHEMPLGVNRASSHLALSLGYDIRHIISSEYLFSQV